MPTSLFDPFLLATVLPLAMLAKGFHLTNNVVNRPVVLRARSNKGISQHQHFVAQNRDWLPLKLRTDTDYNEVSPPTYNDKLVLDAFESDAAKADNDILDDKRNEEVIRETTQEVEWSITSSSLETEPQGFPLGLFVGQDLIKKALVLAAANPRLGGVIIHGGRGTGKSVLAKTIKRLMPEFGIRNTSPTTHAIESIPAPFVHVPLNVMEDALIGSIDLEQSMTAGTPVFGPGLLAKSHGGILYVDDINLMEEEAVSIIMNTVADGFVKVEREGLSLQYPCRPLLIATYNPQEGDLREHVLDRVAICLPATTSADTMSVADRVKVVENVEGFFDKTVREEQLERIREEERHLREKIVQARVLLPQVQISHDQLLYLCQEATRAGCEGQRAEIFATEVAKTSAALGNRTKTNANDLQLGVFLAIAPRGRCMEEVSTEDDHQEQTFPEQEPPPSPDNVQDDDEDYTENEEEEDQEEEEPDLDAAPEVLEIPQEFLFGVDATPIDPHLMAFSQWTKKGKGGKRSQIMNMRRGRFVKAVFPRAGKRGRIALGATLRAAAPYQRRRRERVVGTKNEAKLVQIRQDDFRHQQLKRKTGSLVIFVVDASGSMALNRMGAAKGAAMTILEEAYKSRDKICLIAFHDDCADVLVPPTKSMALTKNRLEGMPCGGGSPLAHALMTAMHTGLNSIKVKQDVGRVVIILLTDGRANVPLYISIGEKEPKVAKGDEGASESNKSLHGVSRKFLKEEVLAVAKKLQALSDFDLLCIDTEDKFVSTGMASELTRIAMGNYHHLFMADSTTVAEIAKQGLEESRRPP